MEKKRWTNDQIAEIVKQTKKLGLTYKEAARRFGVPLGRIYRFNFKSNNNEKYDPETVDQQNDLAPKSLSDVKNDAPKEPSDQTSDQESLPGCTNTARKSLLPEQVGEIIVDYKRQNPYCGFKRIEQYLRNTYFLIVPRKRIREVLKDAGLLELNDSSFDQRGASSVEAKGTRRFEAGRSGELYQMDITYVYITGLKVVYLIDMIDDHSRFCLRSELRFDQGADTLIEVLHDAIVEHGKPDKLLTDQGSVFYSWSGEKTKFQQYLDDQQIEHIVADPHSPTTTGKVERFHQTIKNELIRKVKFKDYDDAVAKIKAFVRYYNYERPHQGLGGGRPADRFMGINAAKTLAQQELLDKELNLGKGYLIVKYGAHEVSILLKSDEAPEIFVNGVLYVAQKSNN